MDEWKGLLTEKFEGFEPDPGKDLWMSLEERLDSGPKKKRAFWLWSAGLAVAAAIALLLMWRIGVPASQPVPKERLTKREVPAVPPRMVNPGTVSPTLPTATNEAPEIPSSTPLKEHPSELASVQENLAAQDPLPGTIPVRQMEIQASGVEAVLVPPAPESLAEVSAPSLEGTVPGPLEAVAMVDETREPGVEQVFENRKARQIRLEDLNLEDVLVFTAKELDKRVSDNPIQAKKEHQPDQGRTTFSLRIGSLSIVKKKYEKPVKNDKT